MADDVDAVVRELFERDPAELEPRRPRRFARLDAIDSGADAIIALDYADADHVFVVTIEKIPRLPWLPEDPIHLGVVDGVRAELSGVTVDNFVHVALTAEVSDERDKLLEAYEVAVEQWGAVDRDTRGESPDPPASRLAMISVLVSDDVGTDYALHSGRYGGSGTEWEAIQSFRPRPPAAARVLTLLLRAPDGSATPCTVPLH